MPYYQNKGWERGDFKLAEKYYVRCISLPMYSTLNNDEIDYIIYKINNFHGDSNIRNK